MRADRARSVRRPYIGLTNRQALDRSTLQADSACSRRRNYRVCKADSDCGHTLLELLVALTITLTVTALVGGALRYDSDVYLTDAARTKIQQNLRGALDIIAMNVRQAGEGLDSYFPALSLSQSEDPETSVLSLRRKILDEVLSLCKDALVGDTKVFVSNQTSSALECLPTNIASGLAAWVANRSAHDGKVRIYIYNRVAKQGEFLDYTHEGQNAGDDYLDISALKFFYPASSTALYVLEEYSFQLNPETQTLQLNQDGRTDGPADVAYNVTQFQVKLRMQDTTELLSLAPTDTKGWKNIRGVSISLRGQGGWRSTKMSREVTAEYFPRNVLSK